MSKINTDKLLERVESLFENGRCKTCYMEGAYCQEMKNDVMHRCVFMEIIEHLGEMKRRKCEDEDEMV